MPSASIEYAPPIQYAAPSCVTSQGSSSDDLPQDLEDFYDE